MGTAADSLCAAFAGIVAREPLAVACASPSRSATRADVDALSRGLASRLAAARLEEGAPVGLSAPNGPAFLAGLLAAWHDRRAAILLDPAMPRAERRRCAAAFGAGSLVEIDDPWPVSAAAFDLSTIAVPGPQVALRDAAVVKLTSGSTGAPTGLAVTAAALEADEDALSRSMGIGEDDRIVAAIPMGHSYGLSSVALPALLRGCLLAIPDGGGPFASLAAAESARATVFPTAPAWLEGVLRLSLPPSWPRSVRLVVSASAPLAPHVAARFRQVHGLPVHAFYGASECGGTCYDREGSAAERGTVGEPVEGVRVEIRPAPGEPPGRGLVVVRSAALASACLPIDDGRICDGAFRSSDLAEWSGGELRLAGRVDGLINVKGWKVSPQELEAALRSMPSIQDAAVVADSDPSSEGRVVIRALVVGTDGLAEADVIGHCRGILPARAVPQAVLLVREIPRTGLGKLDRQRAVELLDAASGDP